MPEEENFPRRSPTRDAVEREMREPSNLRAPAPKRRQMPSVKEAEDELGDGSPAVDPRRDG